MEREIHAVRQAIEWLQARPRAWLAAQGIALALMCLSINLVGNGQVSLWDRDEPRYAGCTRAMRESGDWIDPTFNGEPRYHKPVLVYWLMIAGMEVGGDNPFGARLVSAVMGTAACLLVWQFGRRLISPLGGILAALALATAPIFAYNAKLSTTDATLTCFLVLCQWALWELALRNSRGWALTFWVGLALATLTKGPIGPVLIAFACFFSWWWGGPTSYLSRLRWSWGPAVFALITAPWYIAIGFLSNGDFYRVAMGYHVMRRMTQGIETHGGFPGYYIVLSLAVFYPWSAFLPPAIYQAWTKRRLDPRYGFLLGWVLGPLVFLELVRTKLIHYYLPAYPGAALLVAGLVVALAGSEVNLRRWPLGRLALALLTTLGIGVTVAFLAGVLVLPPELRWPCLALGVVLGAGTLFALERIQAGRMLHAAGGLTATWAGFMLLMAGALLPRLEPYRMTQVLSDRLATLSRAEAAQPVMASYKPPGVVWELGRIVPEIGTMDELRGIVSNGGRAVAGLYPQEIRMIQADPSLVVEPRGTIDGFDVEHARPTTLHLVVVRAADRGAPMAGTSDRAAPAVAGAPGQDALVK
jgi:4-amino-4-deoxy-L-arabinose transferase-like glycosyltransferase